MNRILMVDDEANVLAALTRILRREFGEALVVETFPDPRKALKRAREVTFDAVLSDYRMPGMDGIAFLSEFRVLQPDTTRLILSGMTDFDVLMAAINEVGISRFMPKPWDDAEFSAAVREAISTTEARREQQRLADDGLEDGDAEARERAQRRAIQSMEPGILHVQWGPNGEVLLDEDDTGA